MSAGRPSAPRIHVWIPDHHSSPGGIQTFSRFFVRALGDCLPEAEIGVLSKSDDSYPSLERGGGKRFFRCAGWWPMPYRTLLYACQIGSRALVHHPDLILATHANFAGFARLFQSVANIPFGVVAHGIEVWDAQSASLRGGLRAANRILAVSRFTRERLLKELAMAPAAVGLLPNTFLPEQFAPAAKPRYLLHRYGLRPEQPVILTVSRLAGRERYKGYDQILQALAELRRTLPDVRYVLGGRGDDRLRVERMARDLGVREHLTLTGFIPDHELEDHYNLCDVFAMPSKGEGFGIVFLEAMACGKPVLAGNCDGSTDAVLDGELGVLVNPDDVPAITQALRLILLRQHPLAILQRPVELRRRVIEAYGYPRFVACLAEHLRNLGFAPAPER
jgi:glycosyltransferase involved in cell wall biosynthesis